VVVNRADPASSGVPQRGKDSYLSFLIWAMSSRKNLPTQGELQKLLHKALTREQVEASNGKAFVELASVIIPSLLLGSLLLWKGVFENWVLTISVAFLQAIQLYRLSSMVHDMIHRSFFKTKRLNDFFGLLLGPFVLFKYYNTRRSHLEHHRHSQGSKDPKIGINQNNEHTTRENYQATFKGRESVLRLQHVLHMPVVLRHITVILIFCIFSLRYVFFGTELAPWKFDTRKKIYVLMDSVCFFGLWALAFGLLPLPIFAAFLLAPLPIYVAFLALVFLAHAGWKSISPLNFNEHLLLCFNINNLSFGARLDSYLKNFHNFHFEHHLYPNIPAYRLASVSKVLRQEYGHIIPAKKPVSLEYVKLGIVDGAEFWDIYTIGSYKFWARKHIETRTDW
jgi:omega-6 fatty acid desaturase (delta-12 desaturase)